MNDLWSKVEPLLLQVLKPGRYIGNERNSIVKKQADIALKVALAFPDLYEVGMSNSGLQIIYSIINAIPDVAAERVFAPWPDMARTLRENSIPLFSLETKTPLSDFDIIGFSLSHEMTYTNILNILNLARIPLKQSERASIRPLVIGGGCCTINPEPLSDFFDLFVVGDGEEVILELIELYKKFKDRSPDDNSLKTEFLKAVSQIKGIYAPSLYECDYGEDGLISRFVPKYSGLPKRVERRVVRDLDSAPYPTKPIVPYIRVVHDRINIEIMRGCPHGCRFCQARAAYGPLRIRSKKKILQLVEESYKSTGYDEIGLFSLSSGDHPQLEGLMKDLAARFNKKGVGISLSSLRTDNMREATPGLIAQVRKSGLTFAPEVGSDKQRKAINKKVDMDTFKKVARRAYGEGWKSLKLYFMVGLPGENKEDLDGIVKLVHEISSLRRDIDGKYGGLTISISGFIPKAHTPFEREGMLSAGEIRRSQDYLRDRIVGKRFKIDFHSAHLTSLEGVFSRGDRRIGAVLLAAWKAGAQFDAWREHFNWDIWMSAFNEAQIDPEIYATRPRGAKEILPWSVIGC
ncbi:MAG: TIGR03960 family B12-binding radical SAM protein [Candidatus Omnitrophica bacterium]|nr:TIGR03960 family B12-binding radical SAM protein [Candidatus Omnitrophota bacterium]